MICGYASWASKALAHVVLYMHAAGALRAWGEGSCVAAEAVHAGYAELASAFPLWQNGALLCLRAGAEGGEALAGFWAAVADSLLVFPLTRTLRESLLRLACANAGGGGGSAPQQQHAQQAARPGAPLQHWALKQAALTAPPVVGILLQLLLGCDDAGERAATLEALHTLIGARTM